MRSCPNCSRPVKPYGVPTLHGDLLDQIVVFPRCSWNGVETVIADSDYHEQPKQMSFDFGGRKPLTRCTTCAKIPSLNSKNKLKQEQTK